METRQPACRQSACPIATSGLCLEGFKSPGDECPHFIWADNLPPTQGAPEHEAPPSVAPSRAVVRLPLGEAIAAADMRTVTHAHAPDVIAVLGPPASGKTTLFGGIWEAFSAGPIGGLAFAGSLTQPGFESLAFPGRTGSGNPTATTERTLLSRGVRYLHLAVRDVDRAGPARHLLLSDVPGEMVQNASASAAGFDDLAFLGHADRILVLVDGEDLADPARRHHAVTRTRSLLRTGIDSGALPASTPVDVAVSKWDLVHRLAETDALTGRAVEKVRELAERTLSGREAPYEFRKIAARPRPNSGLGSAYGLADLLGSWVALPPRTPRAPFVPERRPGTRESAQYLWRRPRALTL